MTEATLKKNNYQTVKNNLRNSKHIHNPSLYTTLGHQNTHTHTQNTTITTKSIWSKTTGQKQTGSAATRRERWWASSNVAGDPAQTTFMAYVQSLQIRAKTNETSLDFFLLHHSRIELRSRSRSTTIENGKKLRAFDLVSGFLRTKSVTTRKTNAYSKDGCAHNVFESMQRCVVGFSVNIWIFLSF